VVALPSHPCRVETRGHPGEEVARIRRQEIVDGGRPFGDRLVARVLAVEDSQRVALEPVAAFIRQFARVSTEVIDKRLAPSVAARGIAKRVELE
jgi:hypothetical protein